MVRQIILFSLSAAIVTTSPASAQPRSNGPEKASAPAISCDAFLPARKQVGGKSIGPDECKIVSEEVVFNLKGRGFRRFELRISGTLDGVAVKQGARTEYFNDAPDFVFAQSGNNGPRFHSTGRYLTYVRNSLGCCKVLRSN